MILAEFVIRDADIRSTGIHADPRPRRQADTDPADAIDLLLVQFFQIQQGVVGAAGGADQLIELELNSFAVAVLAVLSRFWLFWIRNTMMKVTMFVPVQITGCQVSE